MRVIVLTSVVLSSLATIASVAGAQQQAREPAVVAREIDRRIDARLAAENIPASPRTDDAEFLRRAYLDITGRIPPLEKTRAFLDSEDPQKRPQLINELLASPQFGEHFGKVWHDQIAPRQRRELLNEPLDTEPFARWLADAFNQNRRWNEIVADILTAEGAPLDNPPTAFLIVNGNGNGFPQPNQLARSTAHLFMGVQFECAECHDHPSQHWTQADFWGTAAFFRRLKRDSITHKKPNYELVGKKHKDRGGIKISRDAFTNIGQLVKTKLPGGPEPQFDLEKPFRPVLADWLTSPDNPYFAKAALNRFWAHFFARGFVNPLDGFDKTNPPSHPELLEMLADELTAAGFDLKHFIRCICNSNTYQRTSQPLPENKNDVALFSHVQIKVLTPRMLVDSLAVAMENPELLSAEKPKQKKGQPPVYSPREEFELAFSTKEEAADPIEYSHGIVQALRLMNDPLFNEGSPIVERLHASSRAAEQIINELYLATLSRNATPNEQKLAAEYVRKQQDLINGYNGVLWTLLNRSEFMLNH